MSKINNINYILPNFMYSGRNEILIRLQKKYLNVFVNNSNIYSFYGTFPNAIFNGGRASFDTDNCLIKEMKFIKHFYNKNNKFAGKFNVLPL